MFAAEAPDVAACRRVGGAAAFCLAFSFAARIMADVFGFFTGVGAGAPTEVAASLGFALFNSLRAGDESVAAKRCALTGHTI